MSRTARATTSAALGYVKFALAMATGLWLVPFTLQHVGSRMYGLWLASGELLAYASLTEFGVLTTVPWLVAEADGRGDRDELRRLMTTAIGAAVASATLYAVMIAALVAALPSLVHLDAVDRMHVLGPVLIIAVAGVVVPPLRVFYCVLVGLQDVRFNGVMDPVNLLMNVGLTALLLQLGFGLYALALGTVIPQFVAGLINVVRVGAIAPDLLRGWQIPSRRAVRGLFREGMGAWVGGWGWRLISATDGLVLAALGRPTAVTALACTNKLAAALVQLSWLPCDSGLIGLANLAGERRDSRLREAIVVMVRVYLAFAAAAACVVLAVNPAFVSRWVGGEQFAGGKANALIALVAIVMTLAHAVAVVPSVLGERLQVGFASFGSGIVHVGLAVGLGRWLGIEGVLLAGLISHGVVFPGLAWRSFVRATGMRETALFREVILPWAIRLAPLALLAIGIEQTVGVPPMPITVGLGGLIGLAVMWHMRPLYLQFGPVRAMYDRVFAGWLSRAG